MFAFEALQSLRRELIEAVAEIVPLESRADNINFFNAVTKGALQAKRAMMRDASRSCVDDA